MLAEFDAQNNNDWAGGFVFGDGVSYRESDAYGCLIIISTSGSSALTAHFLGNSTGSYLARSHTQLGSSLLSARYSHGRTTHLSGGTTQAYPAPADNALHLWPVECWEGGTVARGMMPGLWNPIHSSNAISDNTLVTDIPQLPARTFGIFTLHSSSYRAGFDLTGPWR